MDVSRPRPLGHQLTRIGTGAAVADLVAAAVRKWKDSVAVADAGQCVGQIGEPMGNEVHEVPFAPHLGRCRNQASRPQADIRVAKNGGTFAPDAVGQSEVGVVVKTPRDGTVCDDSTVTNDGRLRGAKCPCSQLRFQDSFDRVS